MAQGTKTSARDLSHFTLEAHATALEWLPKPLRERLEECIAGELPGWRARARQLQVCTAHFATLTHALNKLADLAATPAQRNAQAAHHRRLIQLLSKLDDANLTRYCAKYNVDKASFGADHAMLLEALADEMEA